MGKLSMVKPVTQRILPFLRHFMIILKPNFVRASILHHITDTDNTYGHAFQIWHCQTMPLKNLSISVYRSVVERERLLK